MRKILCIPVFLLMLASLLWYCSKEDFSTSAVTAEQTALTTGEMAYPFLPLSVCDQQLMTFTQEDWGAPLRGQLPINYLYKGFYEVFGPDGRFGPEWLIVGCDYKNRIFTSPESITAFLPDFKEDWSDRVYTYGEEQPYTLLGEVTALSLNVYYDLTFPEFGPSRLHLKEMLVINTETRYDGWTVEAVLLHGNQVVGGCLDVGKDTRKELHSVITKINRNYQYGEVNRGYLNCPPVPYRELETIKYAKE